VDEVHSRCQPLCATCMSQHARIGNSASSGLSVQDSKVLTCVVVAELHCHIPRRLPVRKGGDALDERHSLFADVTHEQRGVWLQELHRALIVRVPLAVHVADQDQAKHTFCSHETILS